MLNRIRDFLASDKGRYAGFAIAVLGVLLAIWMIVRQFGGGIAAQTATRVFVDANTGESFTYRLSMGEMIPVPSPHSGGQRVGYEAEPCHWTREGQPKQEPTWVLVRVKVDPQAGPTFCPDCGRLVVPRNPPAGPGMQPPPTEAEYKNRRGGGSPAQQQEGDR